MADAMGWGCVGLRPQSSARQGDGFQTPSTFVLLDGKIVKAYRYDGSGDRPNYVATILRLANCPQSKPWGF